MPPVPLVDATDVIRLVGPGSFDRAKVLVRDHRVQGVRFDDETLELAGSVQGSDPAPYEVEVSLARTRGEAAKPVRSRCTCFVGSDCKHVAALLLQSNADTIRGTATAKLTIEQDHAAAAAKSAALSWKDALDALTGTGTTERAPATPMGLQFELRERTRAESARWGAPTSRAGTAATAAKGATFRLGVRPVTQSATGNWVRGTLTWTTLPFSLNRLGANPDQHRWFGQFQALHRSIRDAYLPGDSEWLFLDDFASPLLWPLLAEGSRLGIALLTGKREVDVVVAERAAITIDVASAGGVGGSPAAAADLPRSGASRVPAASAVDSPRSAATEPPRSQADPDPTPVPRPSARARAAAAVAAAAADAAREAETARAANGSAEAGADLRLTSAVVIDGHAHPAASIGVIADHGVYAWSFTPALHLVLAPTGPLTDEQRALVTARRPIDVPAAEAPEFLRDFYPRLTRVVDVVSTDSSVALPEILPPLLVLTATFGDDDRLDLDWAWHDAGRREKVSAHPLPTGLIADLGAPPVPLTLRGLDAAEFVERVLPVLEARDDVRVDVVGERPDYRELTEPPSLTVTTVETDKRDWFDLGVLVTVEGRTIPFAPLFTALSKGRDKLLLVDKSYLSLRQPIFDGLRRLIAEAEALDEWDTGELRINRYQASLWSEFEELADATRQSDAWSRTVGGLQRIAEGQSLDETPVPDGVHATLRPYQVDGFRWLAFLHEHELGGVLADDMGLGKTLQTLALFEHARAATGSGRPFLVVAPTSVVSNWLTEAARFAPGLRVAGVTTTAAKGRLKLDALAATADVVVTSYALFRLDFAKYQAIEWAGLVLDEAQMIKNRQSKAHRAAFDLNAPFKLAITGTPMENDLMDLWSLFHVVSPGLLSTGLHFTDEYVKPIAQHDRPELLARLRSRVRPLMLRRTKELVAPDLPEKQEQLLRVDLEPAHRKLYDLFLQRERLKLLDLVDDLDRNRFIVFRSLTLLRMLALDATLVDAEAYAGVASSKLDVLIDELVDVIAGGHRALIFSQFTSYLAIVRRRLDERGIGHEYLDGSTRNRADVISAFKTGEASVFLISLKAGGFGLNLTEADYVFLLDPWWNPATESQAIDRTHRIGQTSNVFVYRMIANDTIEEKVMLLKEKKAKLFDAMMDDDEQAFGASLTADDIRGLLD